MSPNPDLRQRIVAAAAEILRRHGTKRLTQPEVAKKLGIRQSHLTYYYPRRADLLMALADQFLDHVTQSLQTLNTRKDPAEAILIALNEMVTTPSAMRSFLGLLIEADRDPALRKMLATHLDQFTGLVARELGRPASDPDVLIALAALRGIAMEGLLHKREHPPEAALAIGRRLGLLPSEPKRPVRKTKAASGRKRPASS